MRAVPTTRRAALGLGTVALLAGGTLAETPTAGAAAAPLAPCPEAHDRTLCGRVTVPLDRSGGIPGTIGLRVRALPPRRGRPTTGTILALAGGPGQAAVPLLDDFASVLGPAVRTRQLVTFDQRGTGGSGRLRCAALSGRGTLVDVIGRCAAELGVRRTAYTSAASVADVEAVRAALGVDRLILFGASYGTKVALMYAAAYPQHVERLVLDSVVPPQGVDPFQRTTLSEIPRILRTLCRTGCPFTRDPAADLTRLARRLARRPLRGTVIDGDGRPRRVALPEPGLLALLLAGDFDRFMRAAMPAAVRAALDGDSAPLLRLAARASGGTLTTSGDSDALYAATTCEDGTVPWPEGTPLAQRRGLVDAAARAIPDAAFAPFDRAAVRALGTADLCRAWPESPIPQALPPLAPAPTLILSGDDDLRTPRADAAAVAAQLPDAQLVRVHDAAHGVLFSDVTDCAQGTVADFLDGRRLGRCARPSRAVPPSPLPPRRLGALRPTGRLAGRPGRTVTAIVRTLDDATEQLFAQLLTSGDRPRPFGGLRAGSAVLDTRSGLRLRAYAYVAGVTLSGTLPPRGQVTLIVGGAAAARGRVTISRGGLVGVLGGERVAVSARALGWRAPGARGATAATLDWDANTTAPRASDWGPPPRPAAGAR